MPHTIASPETRQICHVMTYSNPSLATTAVDLPLMAAEAPPRHGRRGGDCRPREAGRMSGAHRLLRPVAAKASGQGATPRPREHPSAAANEGGRPPPPSLRVARVVPTTRSGGGAAESWLVAAR
jgi:hypothetical protein